MPVVGDKGDVLAVGEASERELLGGDHGGLAEHGEAELVVLVVLAPLGPVELLLGLAPNLLEKERVVDEDAVDTLLEGVEEADGGHAVSEGHLGGELGVPRVVVLVVAGGDGHDAVAELGHGAGKAVADGAKASGDGPGGNLGRDEDNLKLLAVGRRGHATAEVEVLELSAGHQALVGLVRALGHDLVGIAMGIAAGRVTVRLAAKGAEKRAGAAATAERGGPERADGRVSGGRRQKEEEARASR
mmetsp:Transcript_2401/g.4834  ORF Transcript_2401/g.4834 Transcript_2401/m.4834 type:complete len:245 (-) Transcript_2401:62-796(-)